MARWRVLAALLIISAGGLHLLYLARDCPLDLAPDEAHYWDWSRHLDWSYYSKGPLIAYLIRGGVVLFGSWSERLIGNEMLAVRLPAVLCGGLLLISLYVLTVQVFRSEAQATAVVGFALTLPAVTVGASLMTIDAPYACCWGWALVLGYRAFGRRTTRAWFAVGLVIGLGILAKYTMILWIGAFALFLATNPYRRRILMDLGFWIMVGTALACCLPIIIWNAQHEWVSFHHVGGQAGLTESDRGIRWLGPIEYAGGQFLVLLGIWFVAWVWAMWAYRPQLGVRGQGSGVRGERTESVGDRAAGPGIEYLWWMSGPVFLLFWVFSLTTKVQLNWPATAYLSGLVMTAAWAADRLQMRPGWGRRFTAGWLTCGCILGISATLLIHHSEWMYPLVRPYTGHQADQFSPPLRKIDPTCRLRGWQTLAHEVDRIRSELRADGVEAELAGTEWTMPGELAFYCQGHPQVYSFGLLVSDRHSQYDEWRPNPVADGKLFAGRTFIVIGEPGPVLTAGFAKVEAASIVTHFQNDQPVARWKVTVCRGFRGIQRLEASAGGERY